MAEVWSAHEDKSDEWIRDVAEHDVLEECTASGVLYV